MTENTLSLGQQANFHTEVQYDEWLRIGREAITDSDGNRYVFLVVHVGGVLWLRWSMGILLCMIP